jgi:predicted dehydrogenase
MIVTFEQKHCLAFNKKPMSISWGIIGCGDVTEKKSGPAIYKVPGSSLVAVMRRDAEKAKDYALRHGVPKWYDDAQSLIEDPDVDPVYVATPPDSHEQYALASMRAGKPVYVEKPMSVDVDASERMHIFLQSTGVKLTMAHDRRALPMFVRIREMIHEGLIGDIRSIQLSMKQHDHPPCSKTLIRTGGSNRR